METKAILKGVRLSEQKGRLVADLIRGKNVDAPLNILQFSTKKCATSDELKVVQIYVEKGPILKRFTARAKGRGDRISKQSCHVYVTVGN